MSTQITTEVLSEVMKRQSVNPAWMRAIADEHGEDVQVEVTTKVTPFGNFVLKVEVAS